MREERPFSAAFLVTSGDLALPITWKQFTDDIDIVVHLIRTYAPGAKFGLLGENSYEWMVAHAACLFSGAVAIPVDINLTAVEIAERMRFTGAVALIHSSLHEDKAHEAGKMVPGLVVAGFGTIKTERFLDKLRGAFGLKDSVWQQDHLELDEDSTGEPQTSMIVFTSGTTSTPRGAELTVKALEDDGFTMVPFGQGFKDMSPPTKELMRIVLEHKLAHGGHPVLRWNMDNAYVRTDPAGNLKLDKEKSTEKVDGAVALVMALDRAMKNLSTGDSVYNHRGLLVL